MTANEVGPTRLEVGPDASAEVSHTDADAERTVPAVLPEGFAERFREASEKVDQAERERDALVIEAHKTASLREIAEAIGVSHTMVAKIIKRASRR